VTGRRVITPLEIGRLDKVPDVGRRRDCVLWKDILDRVPKVVLLCEEEERDMRDCLFVGEGVDRRPEEWVLLFEMVLCVWCELARRMSLEESVC
jgi:hypothetical protein